MLLKKALITFLLSLSLSVDDMVVGVSYGLQKKARIPLKFMAFVVLGSTCSMALTIILSKYLAGFLSDIMVKYISFILLAGLGCKTLYSAWMERKETGLIRQTTLFRWQGHGFFESFYLGLALGIDDFAEALGLAVAGFPIALTVFLFKLSEVIAIYSGFYLGQKELSKHLNGKLAFIPGITLILVGIWQVIG